MTKARANAGLPRRVAARVLTVFGALLVVVTIFSGYLAWQIFDDETFETTAEQLIADDVLRDHVAARTAAVILENVDVEQLLSEQLPPEQKRLAPPLAASFAVGFTRFTQELFARPRLQELWVTTVSETQQQVEQVLDDDVETLATVDGNVVLDLRPIIVELGDRVAIIGRAAALVPEERAVIVIAETDKLEAAQDATGLFKSIAAWIWVVPLALFALAVVLVPGRRRVEIRAITIGLIFAGFLVLAIRGLAGSKLVDDLVPREDGKEAARNAWDILTQLLADGAWSAILLGAVFLAGVILAGPTRVGRSARSLLAPVLASRWLVYGSLAGFLLLLAWWNPIAQTGRLLYMGVFAALLVAGVEALLAVVRREGAAGQASAPPPPARQQ